MAFPLEGENTSRITIITKRQLPPSPPVRLPSHHQLLSDATLALGSALERTRSLQSEDAGALSPESRTVMLKQVAAEADTITKLIKGLQSLVELERGAANVVAGAQVQSLSDAQLAALLAGEVGTSTAPAATAPAATAGPQPPFGVEGGGAQNRIGLSDMETKIENSTSGNNAPRGFDLAGAVITEGDGDK